jgi:uncharacterized protein YuzE
MNKPIKAKFDYDFHNDVLYMVQEKREYYSSIQNKNFIFDLDRNNNINGIEILDFSKIIGASRFMLGNIRSGIVHIETIKADKGTLIKLHIHLECEIRHSNKMQSINTEDISVSEPEYLKPACLNLATA